MGDISVLCAAHYKVKITITPNGALDGPVLVSSDGNSIIEKIDDTHFWATMGEAATSIITITGTSGGVQIIAHVNMSGIVASDLALSADKPVAA